jgi:C4-dicarboxylate-specific signal transduction histidine kinase
MEYEAEVNRSVGDQRMLLLCTYPLTSAANVFDVARTHQFAVAKRHGQWEVVETPELTHAKAEIARLNHALDQRAALAHRARLATINEVTAALAHRVNQPLTAIMANAATSVQRLERLPPAIDDATAAMRLVIRQAKRASAVISHARALVKTLDDEKRLVDINDVIREVLSLLEPELSEHDVLVEAPLSDSRPLVLGKRTKLQQAVLSLIMNAVEAMADVTTRPRRLLISCERGQSETGPDILVAVQDNGIGTTAHDLESLFDPFFTTKRDGLGMGLSIGRSVAQAHGGRLWARRNVDHGLTFYLLLPETSSRPV